MKKSPFNVAQPKNKMEEVHILCESIKAAIFKTGPVIIKFDGTYKEANGMMESHPDVVCSWAIEQLVYLAAEVYPTLK